LVGTWRVAFADFVKSLNIGMDRRIAQDKIIGFALGLGKQDRTATGIDFSGDVDTKQYTLSSYGALETYIKRSKIKLSLICPCSVAFTNHHFGIRPSIPTLNLTAGGGDNIAQPDSVTKAVLKPY
jgi:hypothetical protein